MAITLCMAALSPRGWRCLLPGSITELMRQSCRPVEPISRFPCTWVLPIAMAGEPFTPSPTAWCAWTPLLRSTAASFRNTTACTISSNFVMHGTDVGMGFATADYFLGGGTFSAGGVMAEAGTFQQDGGTNSIAGNLFLNTAPPGFGGDVRPGNYALGGGFLSVNNI